MRPAIWAVLLASVVLFSGLAGCAKKDEPKEISTLPTPPTGPTPPPPPQAGKVTLTADKLAGVAPLKVNFTLTAEDPNPDGVWTLDFDDGSVPASGDNSALPAHVSYKYANPGNYTAKAQVGYGKAGIQTATVSLQVSVPVVGIKPGTKLGEYALKTSGTMPDAVTDEGLGCGSSSKVEIPWDINGTAPTGEAVQGKHPVIKLTSDPNNVDSDLYLLDPGKKQVGKSAGSSATETIDDATLVLPPGVYTIQILGCFSVGAKYTIDAKADMLAV